MEDTQATEVATEEIKNTEEKTEKRCRKLALKPKNPRSTGRGFERWKCELQMPN
jgi:hypothetical protein